MKLKFKAAKKREEQLAQEDEGRRQRSVPQDIEVVEPNNEEKKTTDTNGARKKDKLLVVTLLQFYVVLALAAILTPCLVWYFLYVPLNQTTVSATCKLSSDFRTPCFDEGVSIDEKTCIQSECCYNATSRECYHTLPSNYGYKVVNWLNSEEAHNLAQREGLELRPKRNISPSRTLLINAIFTVREHGALLQLQFRNTYYPPPPDGNSELLHYNVTILDQEGDFGVQVSRINEDRTLLSTIMGPMLLGEESFWDVVLKLPSNATLLGAHATGAASESTWLYAAPGRPASLPTLLALEEGGGATAVRIVTSAPLRLRLQGSGGTANLLQIRALNPRPENLTIEMVAGDSAAEALRTLMEADVGASQMAPPLPDWALGLIVCPAQDSYELGASPEPDAACMRFKEFVAKAAENNLPWDAHCVEQSFMWERGTLDCLNESDWALIGDRKLLAPVPQAVWLDEPDPLPPLVQNEKGYAPYVGSQVDADVNFVDWGAERSALVEWAKERIQEAFGSEGIKRLGGVALVENWPIDQGTRTSSSQSESEGGCLAMPQMEVLWAGTLTGCARHDDHRRHFSWHADLPARQASAVKDAVTNLTFQSDAPLVLSDASGPGVGVHAGITGSFLYGAAKPTWASMQASAESALGHGAGGAPLASGGALCGGGAGFDISDDEHLQLCERWYQQGAMLPLMWVASPPPSRHPVGLPTVTSARTSQAVRLRYALLPYIRYLVATARAGGLPVARHLGLEFPLNAAARATAAAAHQQWMLGPALLVAPAPASQVAYAKVFVPVVEGKWRLLFGGIAINTTDAVYEGNQQNETEEVLGHNVVIKMEYTRPVLLIRPHYIIPQAASAHEAAASTAEALAGGLKLTASAACEEASGNENCTAAGDLLLSSGDTAPLALQLSATPNSVTLSWTVNNSIACTAAKLRNAHVADSEASVLRTVQSKELKKESGDTVADSDNITKHEIFHSDEVVGIEIKNNRYNDSIENEALNAGVNVKDESSYAAFQDDVANENKFHENDHSKDNIYEDFSDTVFGTHEKNIKTTVLQDLDVFGVPTEATNENNRRNFVTVRVETLSGTYLKNAVSRLVDGRLVISTIDIDVCSSERGIVATW